MSPVQIIRTVAIALIAGGGALGLIPSGSCGAGWWEPSPGDSASFGWFAYTEISDRAFTTCGPTMSPVGSWATALVVIGVALLVAMWFNTHYRPKTEGEPNR